MSQSREVTLTLGALAMPLLVQIQDAGAGVSNLDELNRLQQDADSITRLYVRNFITSSIAHAARKKLMKQIQALLVVAP